MQCRSTKEIWDKLQNIYKGYGIVKKENLQTYREQFEGPRMKEDENIASYLLCVDEIVITFKGLRETVLKEAIVQKAMRSMPMRFDSKVSILEDRKDLEKFTWMRSMKSSMPMK